MKAIKLQIILMLILISSTLLNAQNYHLMYETDIYSIDLKQTAGESSNSTYSVEKAHQHLLTLQNKKAVSFKSDIVIDNKDSICVNYNSYKNYIVVDRKKTRFQSLMARYDNKLKKAISSYDKKAWRKIAPLSEPKLNNDEKLFREIYKCEYKKIHDTLPIWTVTELKYTEKTKTISGYDCKNVIVIDGIKKVNVWYTEEIEFNWCFYDYRFLIPGTVVLIEQDDKIIFELLRINILDFDDLPVKKEIIDELFKLV
ncbi:MAG: hypothetical protein PHE33_02110 [Bacteroidales bacterium]|nr:hypothetical protein [Bacteroidales bacterium]